MRTAWRTTEISSLATAVWLMLLSPSALSDTPPAAPVVETSVVEAPAAEVPVTGTAVVATPVAEAPPTETLVAAEPVAEAPVAEAPAAETPVAETAVAEAAVAEPPAVGTTEAEAQVAETPVTEAAVAETPVAETPVAETPMAETAVSEPPPAETAAAEARVAETPVAAIAPPPPGTLRSLVHPLWNDLSELQRQVLQPFAAQWNAWPAAEKRSWIALANRVPRMKPEDQARAQRRISEWAQLTPGQRQIARQNYRLARQLPPDERVAQWERYTQLTPEQQTVLRDNGWTSNTAALHAGARTGLAKEAAQPLAPRQPHTPYP